MKTSYKLYTSEAEITYKTIGNKDKVKSQKSNRSNTIVYTLSLPIFHVFSMYNYYEYTQKISHSINIKNNSTMILNNIHIVIFVKDRRVYNLEFLGSNKPHNYYRTKNSINIEVKTLIPNDQLYINMTGYPCYYGYRFKDIAKIQFNAKVMGIDGNLFEVERIENLNL